MPGHLVEGAGVWVVFEKMHSSRKVGSLELLIRTAVKDDGGGLQ